MINSLIVLAVCVPLLALTLALHPQARRMIGWTLPMVPLPALIAAFFVTDAAAYRFDWLLFGGSWSLDPTRRILLASMAAMWCIGGCLAITSRSTRARLPQLVLPWLATLTGNMWLAVAQDIGGFYSGFALMSFAAYALVVADGTAASRSAGRVYLAFTVFGEMAILCGLLLAGEAGASTAMRSVPDAIAQSPHAVLITVFLIVGFGVKCALFGVHMWLPSVYSAAPAPVRVVLGGAMINAGVLGWLCTLPLGSVAASALALPLVVAGLVSALGAAVIGSMQARAATVLGYSSISQMGMITVLLGVGLAAPDITGYFVTVIALFAAHHGVTKGVLFVSADVLESGVQRAWPLMVLPALVLAGAPATTGAIAKLAMKGTLYDAGWSWLIPWLTAAAVGTTLLMARALWCAMQPPHARDTTANTATALTLLGWCAVVVVLAGPWWMPFSDVVNAGVTRSDAIDLLWPIAVGSTVAALWWRRSYHGWRIPAGDLLLPMSAIVRHTIHLTNTIVTRDSGTRGNGRPVSVSEHTPPMKHTHTPIISLAERSEAWLQRHASYVLAMLMLLVAAILHITSR